MSAQGVIGSLKLHPVFGNTITNIIDTGDVIYYVSDNTLYSYDKANDESDSYSRNNRLNDCSIKDIYYNNDRKYLAVVYENSNIDLLTDDGEYQVMDYGEGVTIDDFFEGNRVKITLRCSECKQRNYNTNKNKKNTPDRLELNKYCPFCRKHTVHNETK